MNKYEIKYKGLSTVPSDYDSEDGELSTCLNLINEDGSLKPILSGTKLFSLSRAGERIVYIHRMVGTYTHYVIKYGNQLLYRTDSDATENLILTFSSDTVITEVNSMGNTIIILTNEGVFYCLWKNSEYKTLGQKPPDLDICFGLSCDSVQSVGTENSISADSRGKIKTDTICTFTNKDDIDALTNSVMAIVNRLVAEAKKSNMFTFPFYVRYAYRMYDGTYIMHSVPILMLPSTLLNPMITLGTVTEFVQYMVLLIRTSLQMGISGIDNKLYEWADIVTSLDIFVSDQFYPYDESGDVKKIYGRDYSEIASTKFKKSYSISGNTFGTLPNKFFLDSLSGSKIAYIDLPSKDGFDVKQIGEPMNFYLFKSFDIGKSQEGSELAKYSTYTPVYNLSVADNYLTYITQKETLLDDYYSHEKVIAKSSYVYNKRLNLANIERIPFTNLPGGWLSCYSSGIWRGFSNGTDVYDDVRFIHAKVYISHDGVEHVASYTQTSAGDLGGFFFYPNPDAYKIVLSRTRDPQETDYSSFPQEECELTLKRHPYLNGAYYFAAFEELVWVKAASDLTFNETVQTYKLHNTIYTSAVNNPFCFLAEGVNSVGLGEIFGIRSAAKALSQGQFGVFPLYAFCDDGVWALEVSSTGIYRAIQPISGDICLGTDSIAQIDNSVMFLTSRGLMLISGSRTQCVSLSLDNDIVQNSLPYLYSVIQDSIVNTNMFACNFKSFIANAFITYDYTHQRIMIFNKDNTNYPFAFVYSLKSKLWSMMDSDYVSAVNNYPSSYLMTKDMSLVDISDSTGGSVSNQLLVTRPIKIEPDNYKTIYSLLQRGSLNGTIKTVLYGSRDLKSWFAISSSSSFDIRGIGGTGYKYFVIVSLSTMDKNGRLSGASLIYSPKMINRLR